jgi:predicted DNA-binding transcriptional regulator YafY
MAASGAGLHESLPPAVTVSLTPWGGSPSGEDELQVLKAAIEKKRLARFSYSGLRGPSRRRDVEPFTLALGGSAWYLHGFCRLRGEFRLFRLSRMSDLEILAEKFDPRARLPVPPVWGAEWGVGPVMEVVLRFGPDSIMAVQDSFARRDIVREEDGSFRVSFMWPQEEPPIRFILGFGPGVSVVAPPSLKADVARAARELVEGNSTS